MDTNTILGIVSTLLAISEGLALIPGLKSNSIFQMAYLIIKTIANGIKNKEV